MKEFKLCPIPSCNHHNSAGALFCEICQVDLGDVPFSRFTETAPVPDRPESPRGLPSDYPGDANVEVAVDSDQIAPASVSSGSASVSETPPLFSIPTIGLSLVCPNGRVIQVNKSTAVVGQYNPDRMPQSLADIQLVPSEEMADVRYIHRQHCRLDFQECQWFVTPLPQPHLGPDFTGPNPTGLGNRLLVVGEKALLSDQDILTLGCLPFTVRIRARSGHHPLTLGKSSSEVPHDG